MKKLTLYTLLILVTGNVMAEGVPAKMCRKAGVCDDFNKAARVNPPPKTANSATNSGQQNAASVGADASEMQARQAAERARAQAREQARREAQQKAQEQARIKAQQQAEQQAKLKAQQQAQLQARREAQQKAQQQARQKAEQQLQAQRKKQAEQRMLAEKKRQEQIAARNEAKNKQRSSRELKQSLNGNPDQRTKYEVGSTVYAAEQREARRIAKPNTTPHRKSTSDYRRLKEELAIREQRTANGKTIAGKGHKQGKQINDAPRLATTYGGNQQDWAKKSSRQHYQNNYGERYEIHWYQNDTLQKRVEFKPKYLDKNSKS